MRLILIAVGQKMPDWAQAAFDDYAKRFPPEIKLEVRLVKTQPRHSNDVAGIMAAERQRIEAQIPKGVDMSLYTRIGALNVCIARAAGIEFDKAVAVAGETIAQVIQGQHDGAIAQVGAKPLTIEELRKGAINSAVLGAVEVCPDEVPADVRKKVEDVLKSRSTAPAKKP